MNRNVRRIALGLIAIVLGAGYLLKVIPPETDVGLDENYSVSIDGSLITNPLDINEKFMPKPPMESMNSTELSTGTGGTLPSNKGSNSVIHNSQLASSESTGLVEAQFGARPLNDDEASNQSHAPKVHDVPSAPPPIGDLLASPVYPDRIGPPHLGTAGRKNGTVENADDAGGAPSPSPGKSADETQGDAPSAAGNPPPATRVNPGEIWTNIPPLPLPPGSSLIPPLLEEFPPAIQRPYIEEKGPTRHDVPDFGGTLLLLTLSLAGTTIIRALVNSKTGGS